VEASTRREGSLTQAWHVARLLANGL